MARTNHRPRRPITVARGARLLPLMGFRYSATRDAYVLRFIGGHVGPVYQVSVRPSLLADTHSDDAHAVDVDARKLSAK